MCFGLEYLYSSFFEASESFCFGLSFYSIGGVPSCVIISG